MKWVKSSERLPDENGSYFCKCNHNFDAWIGAFVEFYEGDFQNDNGYPDNSFVQEWLDESNADYPPTMDKINVTDLIVPT